MLCVLVHDSVSCQHRWPSCCCTLEDNAADTDKAMIELLFLLLLAGGLSAACDVQGAPALVERLRGGPRALVIAELLITQSPHLQRSCYTAS